MIDRERAIEAALGSVRMEGLEPSEATLQPLAAWARGEASNEDLRAADDQLLASRAVAAASSCPGWAVARIMGRVFLKAIRPLASWSRARWFSSFFDQGQGFSPHRAGPTENGANMASTAPHLNDAIATPAPQQLPWAGQQPSGR